MSRAALALLLLAAGCRRAETPAPQGDPRAASAPLADPSAPAAPYRVEAVANGGTLTGVVRWDGPRPSLAAFTVGPVGNPAVCGATQPAEALQLSDDGGVAFVVLSLSDITRGRAPDPAVVTVDQTACRYVPHVTAVATGTEVRFTNSDRGAIHNVHAYYGYDVDDNWFNATTPFGVATARVAQRPGVARLTCDAGHVWMTGYLLAFPHPYFAVTDARGCFTIRDIPPGTYTLHAWHEGWEVARREGTGRARYAPPHETDRRVTIAAGGTVDVTIPLRANGF